MKFLDVGPLLIMLFMQVNVSVDFMILYQIYE